MMIMILSLHLHLHLIFALDTVYLLTYKISMRYVCMNLFWIVLPHLFCLDLILSQSPPEVDPGIQF